MSDEVGDVLFFVDRALDGMAAIVAVLGDERANARPGGGNSAYGLLTHCLGMATWWCGEAIAGRPVERDRAAEFTAAGPVAPLLARVPVVRAQIGRDLAGYEPDSPPRSTFDDDSLPRPMTQRGCLLHVLEELAQHHGQVEGIRDALA